MHQTLHENKSLNLILLKKFEPYKRPYLSKQKLVAEFNMS